MQEGNWYSRFLPPFLSLMVALVLLAEITHWPLAVLMESVGLMAAALVCLPASGAFTRWFVAVAGGVSIALAVMVPVPPSDVLAGAASAGPILSVLILVELLGAAIRTGRYDTALTAMLLRYARTAGSMRKVAGFGAFMLALTGMFVASIPTIYYSFAQRAGGGLSLALSASRGFAAAAVLSPLAPVVVLAVAASGTSLASYMLYAAPVSLMLFALDWLPRRGDARVVTLEPAPADPAEPDGPGAAPRPLWRRAHTLAGLGAVSVFALMYRLGGALHVNSLARVALAVLGGSLVLGMAERRAWTGVLRGLPAARFGTHASSVPLFAAGGLMGSMLVSSGQLGPLVGLVQRLHLPMLEMPFMMLLVIAFRWMGVAPVISILILGPVFAQAVSLSPQMYAVALAFGAAMAFLVTPFSVTSLVMAAATGLTPLEVSAGRQGLFALAAGLLVSMYGLLLF